MVSLGYRGISLIYVLSSLLWITLSDKLLYIFRQQFDASIILYISSGKGYFFVLVTGFMLYLFIRSYHKRLTESEGQYRAIYEGNALPMWIYDPATLRFISVNDAAVNHYGYSREQFLAMTILDIRPPEDSIQVRQSVQLVSKHFKQSGNWRHIKADGTQLFVAISSQQMVFNRKPHVMVVVYDLTEKVTYEQNLKKLNNNLKKEKKKLSETQLLAKVAGWELSLKDKRLMWSDELFKITGIKPVPDMDLFELYITHIHPDDRPQMMAWLDTLITTGRQMDITHRITFPNQDMIRYVRHIAQVEYVGGQPYKVAGSLQDITEVKYLELERNRYLVSWEDTLNNMSEGFYTLNTHLVITQANKHFEEETGMSNTDTIGKPLIEVFPGIENRITYQEFCRALQERISVRFEAYSRSMKKWILNMAYPTEEGLAIYFIDITEQKEKDLRLKEAMERYELVSKATQDTIYDYDMEQDQLTYHGNYSSLLFNYSPEHIGRNFQWWQSIIHLEDQSMFVKTQQQAIENKHTNWSCEYRIDCGNGSYQYVYDQGYLVYNHIHEPVRMIGAIRNVDALKRAHVENKRLAEIITKVNNMIIIMDRHNKITWVNQAFEDYTGYQAAEVLGKMPKELLVGPNISTETLDYITQCKRSLKTFSVEIIHYIRNQQQWVQIEYTPLFDDDGRHTGYIAVHQNITARKEKEERVKRQNQTLQQIAWLSSHEIRRPVASILGLVNLSEEAKASEEKEEILRLVKRCAKELDDIVHDITRRVHEESEPV